MQKIQKKVVYTAVFNNYDKVPAVNPKYNCDFICFTDNPEYISLGWKIVFIELNGEMPAQANRRYKMLPHIYLSDYQCSLYIDGNITLMADPTPLFHKYLDISSMAIPAHPFRNCAYLEANECVEKGIVRKNEIEEQMSLYAKQGFPKEYGLTANGIILRKHLNIEVILLMNSWWEEYSRGCKRDQLSLAYLLWKYKFPIVHISESIWNTDAYFEISSHVSNNSISFPRFFINYSVQNFNKSFLNRILYKIFRLARKIKRLHKKIF